MPSELALTPANTTIEFIAHKLLGLITVQGTFTAFEGKLVAADSIADSTVEVDIQAATVTTGSDGRDKHLKDPDFFDVEKHPTVTFRSTGVDGTDDGFKLSGELVIRGKGNPVTLDVTKTADGYSGSVVIPRSSVGLGALPNLVIKENIEVRVSVKLPG